MVNPVAPTAQSERIVVLDILRGIAIFGILLLNIQSFAFPGIVGHDPSTLNEFGTINYSLWYAVNWIFDGTQRALFSMLFGAGIILFIGRQQKKSDGLQPADYFFRRQLWLILFSLIDIYLLLWNGDILLDYALCGMLLFVFRDWSPKKLILAAGVCSLLMIARENRDTFQDKKMIQAGETAAMIDTTKTKLNTQQTKDLEEMLAFKNRFEQSAKIKKMNSEIEQAIGDYASVYRFRTDKYLNNLITYTYLSLWDVLVFMFLGMAFFKLDIITAKAPNKVYAWMCIVGLAIGLPLSWLYLQFRIDNHFSWFEFYKNIPFSFYEISRTARAIGFFGLVMLLYKSGWISGLFAMMRPAGQMAFTNYLMQSLICGVIFNGIGFGLFGQLQRYEVYLVLVAVCLFQLLFCTVWLKYFNYGPFEWAWRSLTYWKRPPFIRNADTAQFLD